MILHGTYIVEGDEVNTLTAHFDSGTITYTHNGKQVKPFIVVRGERMAYDIDMPIGVLPFEERTRLPQEAQVTGNEEEQLLRAQAPFHTAWIGDALVGYGPSPQVMRVRDIVVVRWHDTDGDMYDAAGDAGKAEPA